MNTKQVGKRVVTLLVAFDDDGSDWGDQARKVVDPFLGQQPGGVVAIVSSGEYIDRGRNAFWHDPQDASIFRAAPVDLPWPNEPPTFFNKQHLLESFADEVCCLLEVPRATDGYTKAIAALERLTGREL